MFGTGKSIDHNRFGRDRQGVLWRLSARINSHSFQNKRPCQRRLSALRSASVCVHLRFVLLSLRLCAVAFRFAFGSKENSTTEKI
jgi:hypothetical protein